MHKKSQSAIEFLSSYGWVLLIVLVAIGTLAYFGIQNPKKFLPESCVLTPGLICKDSIAGVTGFSVVIQNEMGEDINVDAVSIEGIDGVSCDNVSVGNLRLGQPTQVDIPCSGLNHGSTVKGRITGAYTKSNSNLNRSITGEIISEIQ